MFPNNTSARRATHAGSWYTDNARELSQQLTGWLGDVNLFHGPARAIIVPHAGYTYCGSCAAWAYKQVNPALVKRIFILGPLHHVRLRNCGLTVAGTYKTPLYDLKIDSQVYAALGETRHFSKIDMPTDEEEHSIEMTLPYIAKMMEDYKDEFTIVPIFVGSINAQQEALFGSLLADYINNPQNLFVISSDFCHWGHRFRYTYYEPAHGEIHNSIAVLDKQGMDVIESLKHADFTSYLNKSNNTICGRHPIGVLLSAINVMQEENVKFSFKFLKYAQSSKCRHMNDSSVSYAAGSLVVES